MGSAIAAVNEQGELCWNEVYSPYGVKQLNGNALPAEGCGLLGEERGHTGHTQDFESGLVYAQQRYYDPSIGRFLSIDPLDANPSDSRTYNRYSYAFNNPYKYVDPDGRFASSPGEELGEIIDSNESAYESDNNERSHNNGLGPGYDYNEAGLWQGVALGAVYYAARRLLNRAARRKSAGNPDVVTKSVATQFEKKIEEQMGKRGWDRDSVNSTIDKPNKTVPTRDTRWNSDGSRRDDPATAYVREDGHYVVRNDKDGTIVQISNTNKTDWKSPFE